MIRRLAASFLSKLSDRRSKLRKELEKLYSREVAGAVVATSALMKMVEKILNQEPYLFVGWLAVFLVGNWIFVKWKELADAADEAVDKAADAADDGE